VGLSSSVPAADQPPARVEDGRIDTQWQTWTDTGGLQILNRDSMAQDGNKKSTDVGNGCRGGNLAAATSIVSWAGPATSASGLHAYNTLRAGPTVFPGHPVRPALPKTRAARSGCGTLLP